MPGTAAPAGAMEYTPRVDPAELVRRPELAMDLLGDGVTWLRQHAGSLGPAETAAAAKDVGIRSGLYAAEFPVDVGGYALPQRVAVALREAAAATGLAAARHLLGGQDGPSRLLQAGTAGQRQRWLRPLVDGRWTRCLAMTEPEGGSDLSRIRTSAARTDGRWVMSGRKFLISNACDADIAIVLAHAQADRAGGPTFFVFPTDTPGWRVVRELPGMHPAYRQYEVALDTVEFTDDAVLGGVAMVGAAVGMATEWLPFGRVAVAARAIGLARWALGVARRHAADRTISGARLSDHQYIREFLVRSHVKVESARALIREAAGALDNGRVATLEAAMAKLSATEAACEVIDDAMQVLGGRGWLTEYGLEDAYREARLFRIVDGASEVQKEIIFRLLPPLSGDAS